MSIYTYDKEYFKVIDTPEKAYWLGFIYADGSINAVKGRTTLSLEIGLQLSDEMHLHKFLKSLNSNNPIQHRVYHNYKNNKNYESCRTIINCTAMCKDLINLGCVPNKSLILKFPKNDIVPENLMSHFIRGYFDGDGGIFYLEKKYHNNLRNNDYDTWVCRCYFTGNIQFITELKKYLETKVGIIVGKITPDKRSKAISISIYGKDNIKKFGEYIYKNSTVELDRKKEKFDEINFNQNLLINKK